MHDMQMQFTSIRKTKYYSHFEANVFFVTHSVCWSSLQRRGQRYFCIVSKIGYLWQSKKESGGIRLNQNGKNP